ncbi:AraC family transcriptional regulator [Bacteroides fragilis]|nr:AraC family transcriptional regulator [Bacteroides fragilis]
MKTFLLCQKDHYHEITFSILLCRWSICSLDYCHCFYDRQFVTRQDMNCDVLSCFEQYLVLDCSVRLGFPVVNYFAEKVCLSPNYFGDLVKRETGQTAKEYIQLKMLGVAKERLLDPG